MIDKIARLSSLNMDFMLNHTPPKDDYKKVANSVENSDFSKLFNEKTKEPDENKDEE